MKYKIIKSSERTNNKGDMAINQDSIVSITGFMKDGSNKWLSIKLDNKEIIKVHLVDEATRDAVFARLVG